MDEQVIQNINPRQRSRRKAWVELGETDGGAVLQRNENDRLVVFESLQQELSNAIKLTWFPVELAIAVEERH
jgi:adenosyl cobinamide kinase/adenosyl cobinamide phosphate guanylyltransferase